MPSRLHAEALAIVRDLGLLGLLLPYGEAGLVGSVALGLVVKRDIDLDVFTPEPLAPLAAKLHAELVSRGLPAHVHDYLPRGLKVGIDPYPGPSGDWSIDLWLTNDRACCGFGLVERLQATLTPQQRRAVLRLKRHLLDRDRYPAGTGSRIYQAVLAGVRTPRELAAWLAPGDKPSPG